MSKEKQVAEMARIICGLCTEEGCLCDGGYCNFNCNDYERAKRLYSAGYRKQDEPFPQTHENGCEYCKGRAYTKKPLTVITRYGRKIELAFEYCPKCGRKMKGE